MTEPVEIPDDLEARLRHKRAVKEALGLPLPEPVPPPDAEPPAPTV